MSHPPGVVLSGGGANGAYEIGVLKALFRGESPATGHQPLEPGVIAATSIGAFNSAVLLSTYTDSWSQAISALEKVWLERIHLYHPESDFGGALGMLDFQRERVTSLIQRGYLDTVGHDCGEAGCIGV